MPKERNKADSYREKAPIKREKSDACIDSSEREVPRPKVKAYEGDTKAMNNLGVCYERGTGVKVSLEPLRVYRTKRNQSFSGSFSRYFRFPFCLTHHCPYFFPRILANEESGCALAYSSNEMLFLRASSISASRFASAAARSAAMAFCSAAFSAVEPFVFPLAFARSSRSLAASLSYW